MLIGCCFRQTAVLQVRRAQPVSRGSLDAQPANYPERTHSVDHSTSKPELPVSLNASDLHTAEEDLPLSSPVPNGYADLSDSYLSPPKAGRSWRLISQLYALLLLATFEACNFA